MDKKKLASWYVNGNCMSIGNGYKTMPNYIGSSCQISDSTSEKNCTYLKTDGRFTCQKPYYKLGYQGIYNPPYYNYTLPDTYPPTHQDPINPRAYWYLPFDTFDWKNYNSERDNVGQIPKPS
jgi:hypothetical protein